MRPVPSDIQRPDYADHPSGRPSFAFTLLSRLHSSIRIDEHELNTRRAAASRVALSQELHQILSACPSETCAEKANEQLLAEGEDPQRTLPAEIQAQKASGKPRAVFGESVINPPTFIYLLASFLRLGGNNGDLDLRC